MSYVEPTTVKIKFRSETRSLISEVEFDRMDCGPVAPAGLYWDPSGGLEQLALELHRVTKRNGLCFTFETFGFKGELPGKDTKLYYRGWWLEEAMDAALDKENVWELLDYPDDGTDSQCLFTWETICSYRELSRGWKSRYGWATEAAYTQHILRDEYGLQEYADANSQFERYGQS